MGKYAKSAITLTVTVCRAYQQYSHNTVFNWGSLNYSTQNMLYSHPNKCILGYPWACPIHTVIWGMLSVLQLYDQPSRCSFQCTWILRYGSKIWDIIRENSSHQYLSVGLFAFYNLMCNSDFYGQKLLLISATSRLSFSWHLHVQGVEIHCSVITVCSNI